MDLLRKQSNFIAEFEWLRVVAAAAVVMIHVLAGVADVVSVDDIGDARAAIWGVMQVAIRWAVPVFLMITGALLLNPEKTVGWDDIKRYSFRMVGVLFTFGFAYCLMEVVYSTRVLDVSAVARAVLNLLQGRSWSHMWYVYALLGLYLLLPMFRAYVALATRRSLRVTLAILGVFTLAVPTFNAVTGLSVSNLVWLTSSAFYLLLGWYAFAYLRLNRSVVTAGCLCAVAMISLKISLAVSFDSWSTWVENPNDPLIAGWSLLVFLLARKVLNRPYGRTIAALSSASFGIYLLHPLIINVLYKVLDVGVDTLPPVVFEIVVWTAAFSGSWALTELLKHVPLVGRLL